MCVDCRDHVVCEWVGGSLFVMGCCVVTFCVGVNGASPVRFVLSLFYMCISDEPSGVFTKISPLLLAFR